MDKTSTSHLENLGLSPNKVSQSVESINPLISSITISRELPEYPLEKVGTEKVANNKLAGADEPYKVLKYCVLTIISCRRLMHQRSIRLAPTRASTSSPITSVSSTTLLQPINRRFLRRKGLETYAGTRPSSRM